MAETLTLYSSPGSHHCRRVTLLIHEAGMDVELRHVDVRPPGMGGENESDAFLALNPNAKVPVLVDDAEAALTESNAIMIYLCERFRQSRFWPDDFQTRAKILSWQFWQASQFSPAADGLMAEHMMKPMFGAEPDKLRVEEFGSACRRWLSVLDQHLQGREFLVGDGLTCADLSVAAAMMYAHAADLPIPEFSHVANWLKHMQSRDSWHATQPPPMPLDN